MLDNNDVSQYSKLERLAPRVYNIDHPHDIMGTWSVGVIVYL